MFATFIFYCNMIELPIWFWQFSDNWLFEMSVFKEIIKDMFLVQVIDKILNELEPVCLAEQDFCVRFFHLAGDTPVIKEPKQVIN